MLIFVDTSPLVKRYIEEPGSPEVDSLFLEQNDIAIASITPLEMRGALNRKMRENTVSNDTYAKAIGFLEADGSLFTVVPFSSLVIEKAAAIIDSHGARTLGAIQIGSTSVVNPDRIVTSDGRVLEILQSFAVDKIQMM